MGRVFPVQDLSKTLVASDAALTSRQRSYMKLSMMFLASLIGMALTGHAARNQELAEHGQAWMSLGGYLSGGVFLSALFENWESEFLQMAVYVVLTAILFQRGSAESRDPDDPGRERD